MNSFFKRIAIATSTAIVLAAAPLASANDGLLTVGGQVGTLSITGGSANTGLGYGAFIQAAPLDLLSLQVDYLTSQINGVRVQGFAPDLMIHLVNIDVMSFGLLAGPGFYDEGTLGWHFGLNGGAFGEVSFIPQMPIGLQARFHDIFGSGTSNLWSIFMTVGFRFGASDPNDW